ncbi:MAG: hypothetical protein Q9207_007225 [Kuettlingeria erythrocarpa]
MTQSTTGANLSDTVLTATVPAGFEVVPLAHRGHAMPDLICLDLAVRFMSHLADLNWKDLIEPEARSVAGVTIETSLTGTAVGTRGIQVRYVIWGIYRFHKTLPSNEENKNPSDQLRQDHLISSPQASNGTVSAILPPTSPAISADPELEILIFYPASPPEPPIGDYSVYINMLALIVFGSRNPDISRIGRSHGLSVIGYNAEIAVTGPTDTRKPLSRPPFFQWYQMFRAVRVASAEMR